MSYLATTYGENIRLAIKCTKYYRTKNRPFTSIELGINRQTMRNLADKGILKIVGNSKTKYPNKYIVPQNTIEILERRFPNEL